MQKRIFAILALVLFAAGLVTFFVSIVRGANEYTSYALVLCAPGAVLAFMNHMAQKRASFEIKEESEDPHETEID